MLLKLWDETLAALKMRTDDKLVVRTQHATPMIVEPIEPKILYSSDLFPLIATTWHAASGVHASENYFGTRSHATDVAENHSQRSIVFVDSSVYANHTQAENIQVIHSQTQGQEIVVLDARRDGVAQISAALQGRQPVAAIHIISNSEPGELRIGDTRLTEQNLVDHAAAISHWGSALSAGSEITLHSVNTVDGQKAGIITGLKQLTGAAVSTNAVTVAQVHASTVNHAMNVKATYVVTSTANSGAGTLAQAITDSNGNAGANVIDFDLASSGVQTITLTSALPTITNTVTIDGTSEPGYAGTPLVQISGGSAGSGVSGLTLASGASGSIIKGLVINGFSANGIVLNSVSDVLISGNYIGVTSSGSAVAANSTFGIYIDSGSSGNTIGGTTTGSGNVISGNSSQELELDGSNNLVQGNFLGTNAAGTTAILSGTHGLANGILLNGSNNTIGGTATGAGNVISGNQDNGIEIGGGASNNLIQGNYIGTNAAGTSQVGNGFGPGSGFVWAGGSDGIALGGSNNTIGGTVAGAANVISGNQNHQLEITGDDNTIAGNKIGTDVSGSFGVGGVYSGEDGIILDGGSSGNLIGIAGGGNIISGNSGNGVEIAGTNNLVQGNYIGLNVSGTASIGNGGDGISIDGGGATGNTIGGTATNTGNVISGNSNIGIEIDSNGTLVEGNDVGTDFTGMNAIANGGVGVQTDTGANGNTIGGTVTGARNVIAGNTGNGVGILSTNNAVLGNYIGINSSGTAAVANGGLAGIYVSNNNNTIGGTTAGARNVISGNTQNGIDIHGTSNLVQGNIIGLNAAGTAAVANSKDGINLAVVAADNNTIGGTAAGAGNIISGNTRYGIEVIGTSNLIEGNYVGTDLTGMNAIANQQDGILVLSGATANTIGGTASGAGNLVSGNAINGIHIESNGNLVQGNDVGINANGTAAVGNGYDGIQVAGSNNTIGGTTSSARNVSSGNVNVGISVDSGSGTIVEGNYVGVNVAGTAAIKNHFDGIYVQNTSSGNTIGGTATGAGNLVSGNASSGITLRGNNNLVEGNHVGINAAGTAAIANGVDGVYVDSTATGNTIGGTVTGASNVISGNVGDGIETLGSINLIQGNDIGVNVTGTGAIANQTNGILIDSGSTGNTVGGTAASARNIISGNSLNGISIASAGNLIEGNNIGTNAAGSSALANGNDGIVIRSGATGNTIGGTVTGSNNVISGNANNGMDIGSSNNLVEGNYIGVNLSGTAAIGNTQYGIEIDSSGNTGNIIGGTVSGARNIISGNSIGVIAYSTGTLIEGNYIGVNAAGTAALGNNFGVTFSANNNTLGGTASGAANLISGNSQSGVVIYSINNIVRGNQIGINAAGTAAIANREDGIFISGGSANTIGGTVAGAANTISGNAWSGIELNGANNVVEGNMIGTNAAGTVAIANVIDGVLIDSGATSNLIGGSVTGARNIISGNTNVGVEVESNNNIVAGNYIGVNSSGTSAIGNGYEGVLVDSGGNNNQIGGTVAGQGNVVSGNVHDGIGLGSVSDVVEGNYIGINAAGTRAIGNGASGVWVEDISSGDTIGGTVANARNVVSANDFGIYLHGINNLVEGNYVGTNANGTAAIGNTLYGVDIIINSSGNTVGGTTASARNLISGNLSSGVNVVGNNNLVEGNYIGVKASGTAALANQADGIYINSGSSGDTIGGTVTGSLNLISGNVNAGIEIAVSGILVEGNYIGTDLNGTNAIGNGNDGILIDAGATANTIGGNTSSARNIISGNTNNGIEIDGTNNLVEGNYVGTNVSGTSALANGGGGDDNGIYLVAGNNTVGGTVSGAGNLISGNNVDNLDSGIAISGNNNLIEGNEIGTNASGTAAVANGADGVYTFSGATGNTIGGTTAGARNIISGNTNDGIEINSTHNLIEGNYIGTDVTGMNAIGNGGGGSDDGIYINSNNNTIGGTVSGAGNVISGNNQDSTNDGIEIGGNHNLIEGNEIGVNAAGTRALANGEDGIFIDSGATGNTIGGTAATARNIISGNTLDGIFVDTSSTGNIIEGNYIGLNVTGNAVIGNARNGILIDGNTNTVGGTVAGAGNIIVGNTASGIAISGANHNLLEGNDIGTNASGLLIAGNGGDGITFSNSASNNTVGGTVTGAGNVIANNLGSGVNVSSASSTGDQILGNSITNNSDLGILLNAGGANGLQAYPVLTSATEIAGSLVIVGTLTSAASTSYRIEFFSNSTEDGSGYGQGQVYLGDLVVTTNASGTVSFTATISLSQNQYGTWISATATNQSNNNTSQFSHDVETPAPTGTSHTVTTPENISYTFTASDFGFSDIGGQTLAGVEITTLPAAGTVYDNGVAVTAGTVVSIADINAGKLVYTPGNGGHGNGYSSFTFQVEDSAGATDPNPKTMTVNVTEQPPSGTSNTVTTLENHPYTFSASDFGFADINGTTLSMVEITTLPGTGSLTDNGVAVTTGQLVSVADINAGKLVYTPVTNTSGTGYGSFTFQVQDNTGMTDPSAKTMTLNVTYVNQAPSGTSNTVTLTENTTYTFNLADFGFTDPNIPANTLLAVWFTTLPANGTLEWKGAPFAAGNYVTAGDIQAGLLTYVPGTNGFGAGYASFTFQVQNNGGTANGGVDLDPTPKTMTISVTELPPSGTSTTITVVENSAYTFSAATFGFNDVNGTALSAVEFTTLPTAGSLTDSGVAVTAGSFITLADINAGDLVFTPVAGANGAHYTNFTFQVQDNAGTTDPTPKTITVNVTALAPTGTSNTITITENKGYTFSVGDFGFSDVNGSALTAVEITTLPTAGTLMDNGVAVAAGTFVSVADINAGDLVYKPAFNGYGTAYGSFTFQVSSTETDPVPKTMTFNVTALPPTGSSNTVTTQENTAYVLTAGDFGYNDINNTSFGGVKITSSVTSGTLFDAGVAVAAGQVVSIADINTGKLVFTPATNSYGNNNSSFTFQVEDSNGLIDSTVRTMTFNVTAKGPSGVSNTITTPENTAYVFSAGDFGYSDSNNVGFGGVKISTLSINGTFVDNGVAVTAGEVISIADINAGKLVFTPASGAYGNGNSSFTFQVEDVNGAFDATSQTITINVTEKAPTGASNTITVSQNGSYTFSVGDFGFSDVNNTSLTAVEITTLPSAGTLVDNGVAVSAGESINVADINAGELVFTPQTGASGNGYSSFSFQVQDSQNMTDPSAKTMTVNVTAQSGSGSGSGSGSSSGSGSGSASGSGSGSSSGGTSGSSSGSGSSSSSGSSGGSSAFQGSAPSTGSSSSTSSNTGGNSSTSSSGSSTTSGSSTSSTSGSSSSTSGSSTSSTTGSSSTGSSDSSSTSGNSTGSSASANDASQTSSGSSGQQTASGGGSVDSTGGTTVTGSIPSGNRTFLPRHNVQTGYAPGSVEGIASRETLEAQIEGALTGNNNQIDGISSLFSASSVNVSNLSLLNFQISGTSRQLLPTLHGSTDDVVVKADAPVTVKITMDDHEDNSSAISPQQVEIATAISSLGLIWMTGRQALLAYSLLASFPAWQRVDPLLLLEKEEAEEDVASEDESNIDIADHLFSNIDAN